MQLSSQIHLVLDFTGTPAAPVTEPVFPPYKSETSTLNNTPLPVPGGGGGLLFPPADLGEDATSSGRGGRGGLDWGVLSAIDTSIVNNSVSRTLMLVLCYSSEW